MQLFHANQINHIDVLMELVELTNKIVQHLLLAQALNQLVAQMEVVKHKVHIVLEL